MRQYLGSLADGTAVDDVYLVADKQLRSNRNGQPYIQLDLRDRTGGLTARMWNAGEAIFNTFEAGEYLKVKAKVQTFQGALQMIVSHLDRIDPASVDLNDFLPHADADISKLLDRLRQLLRTVGEPHLKALAECFIIDDEFMSGFAACPAGVKNHHAYVGGLLDHVVNLMEAADRLAPLYPDVNRDLWIMGMFLHDVGKVRELSFKHSFAYTDEGQLVGHLVQGLEILQEKVARTTEMLGEPFPPELLLRLRHIILSHHGTYEFGSPKLPMTPEAWAVNLLDNLDAKLHIAIREVRDDRGGGSWTAYNASLQRRFFKGGANGAPVNGDE